MVAIALTGPWKGYPTDDEHRRAFIEADFDDGDWLTMSVPGHWHEHEELTDRRAVLYRTRFRLDEPLSSVGTDNPSAGHDDEQRHWLRLEGVWDSGDVWLDGHYLGPFDGWFLPHEFEITEQLEPGADHVLALDVMADRAPLEGPVRRLLGIFRDTDIVGHHVRGGIWRPVRIATSGPVRMTKNRAICDSAHGQSASVRLRSHFLSHVARSATVVTTIRAPGGSDVITSRRDHELASGATVLEWSVDVPDPQLWWPWELGEQPLYRVSVSVEIDGVISDLWERTIGLRSVAMHQWTLRVNGERLFARGADLWPTSALPADATTTEVERAIHQAKDLGLNLLRVDGHVARRELYDAANRAGMLLWQDLPMRGDVKRTIQATAVESAHRLVDLLGSNPSIVIWCAHHDPTGTATGRTATTTLPTRRSLFGVARQQLPTWSKSVLDRLVGRAFSRADPSRPVVQSSGTWPSAPFFDGTDVHLRFGWNSGTGRDLEQFARRIPRMVRWVSSFGTQSVPTSGAVPINNWPPDLNLLAERYGLDPGAFRRYLDASGFTDAASWIAGSQAYQATLLRRQIETLRRLKYKPTGGFTFAALNDCRPAISFAVFDHEGHDKAAVEAIRAACRPTIVVADRLPAEVTAGDAVLLDVHVVNDRRVAVTDLRTEATLTWPGGEHRWAWRGDIEADAVARVGSINWLVPSVVGPVSLHLALFAGEVLVAENRYQANATPLAT